MDWTNSLTRAIFLCLSLDSIRFLRLMRHCYAIKYISDVKPIDKKVMLNLLITDFSIINKQIHRIINNILFIHNEWSRMSVMKVQLLVNTKFFLSEISWLSIKHLHLIGTDWAHNILA